MRKLMPCLASLALSMLVAAKAFGMGSPFEVVSPSGTIAIGEAGYKAIGEERRSVWQIKQFTVD